MDPSTLIWGLILGSFGFGFFVYGKKQGAVIPLLSGIGLMVIPYVVSNPFFLAAAGVGLIALPFVIKR